ncbi:MAG: PHB depolymerase family esterase [Flavobacteriales bacterium]|nr:PHB depolymerase family esterase [Flavobacteriales bacterium]
MLSSSQLPAIAQELVEVTGFGPDPGNLRMFAHQPPTHFDSSAARPLVVVLHGCGQTAEGFAEHSGWNELADREGFRVIYPQQRTGNNVSRCFNWFQEKDITRGSGEVASINSMVQYALNNWNIDSTRIYIMGASAGAAMAVAAGACYPEVFATVASFAGGPYKCALSAVAAMREMGNPSPLDAAERAALVTASNRNIVGEHYPRMVIMHGLRDHTVDPGNALALVDQWTAVHGMDNVADTVDNSFLVIRTWRAWYADGSGGRVVLYRFTDLATVLVHRGRMAAPFSLTMCAQHVHHRRLGLMPDATYGDHDPGSKLLIAHEFASSPWCVVGIGLGDDRKPSWALKMCLNVRLFIDLEVGGGWVMCRLGYRWAVVCGGKEGWTP